QRRRPRGDAGHRLRARREEPLAGAARARDGQRRQHDQPRRLAALHARRRPVGPPVESVLRARRERPLLRPRARRARPGRQPCEPRHRHRRRGRRRPSRLRGGQPVGRCVLLPQHLPALRRRPGAGPAAAGRSSGLGALPPGGGGRGERAVARRPPVGRAGGRRQRPLGQAGADAPLRAGRARRGNTTRGRAAMARRGGAGAGRDPAPRPGVAPHRSRQRGHEKRGAAMKDVRLTALRRFAIAITVLNLLGHFVLGFEQAWATPIVSLLAAYSTEIALELLDAWRAGRRPRFLGGARAFVDFLLSAHISGLAVAMLLYANDRLLPIAFAAVTAIGSKYLFRVAVGSEGHSRHVFNPSNLGITATLLAFPWVGIAQPYMFTENLSRAASWLLPAVIVCTGSFLNAKLTRRIPLILAWLGAFVLQAAVRHFVLGNLFWPSLNPMTGVAFVLFTFYMVTDPATTPVTARGQ